MTDSHSLEKKTSTAQVAGKLAIVKEFKQPQFNAEKPEEYLEFVKSHIQNPGMIRVLNEISSNTKRFAKVALAKVDQSFIVKLNLLLKDPVNEKGLKAQLKEIGIELSSNEFKRIQKQAQYRKQLEKYPELLELIGNQYLKGKKAGFLSKRHTSKKIDALIQACLEIGLTKPLSTVLKEFQTLLDVLSGQEKIIANPEIIQQIREKQMKMVWEERQKLSTQFYGLSGNSFAGDPNIRNKDSGALSHDFKDYAAYDLTTGVGGAESQNRDERSENQDNMDNGILVGFEKIPDDAKAMHREAVLEDAVLETQDQMAVAMRKRYGDAADDPNQTSGATLTTAVICGNKLYTCIVGDGRIHRATVDEKKEGKEIISTPVCLTTAHNPTQADEAKRLKELGVTVSDGRLEGGLAVSRAMGDMGCEKAGLIHDPDISVVELDGKNYIIISCDGLTEEKSGNRKGGLTTDEMKNIMQEIHEEAKEWKALTMASTLTTQSIEGDAKQKGTTDNVTTQVVFINVSKLDLSKPIPVIVINIYDGHGPAGEWCAAFLKNNFPRILQEQTNKKLLELSSKLGASHDAEPPKLVRKGS